MAEKEAQDAAAKTRIITHMNNDHHDSVKSTNLTPLALHPNQTRHQIVRYLQHYGKIPSYIAYDGRLTDVSLTTLTLTCHNRTIHIPFDPPLTSYRETRERVVELDKQAREALGQSSVTVTQWLPPTGLYFVEFLATTTTFLAYSRRWWFLPGGVVERFLGAGFARFSWQIQPYLISLMLLIHGAEVVFFARGPLARHSVNVRTATWWLWAFSVFTEGVFASMRFEKHVRRLREKQQKH